MQDYDLLIKSINELEFLIAYNRHVISTSKCDCDSFMDNLRELYRLYTNAKYLTQTLKTGVYDLYSENLQLKKNLARIDTDNGGGLMQTIASDAEITAARLNERRRKQQQLYQSQPNLAFQDNSTTVTTGSSSAASTASSDIVPTLSSPLIIQPFVKTTRVQPFNYLYNEQPIATSSPHADYYTSTKRTPQRFYASNCNNAFAHTLPSSTIETSSSTYSSSLYSSMTAFKQHQQKDLVRNSMPLNEQQLRVDAPPPLQQLKQSFMSKSFKSKTQKLKRLAHVKSTEELSSRPEAGVQEEESANYELMHEEELEKRRVSRGRVIDELIQTEVDFFKVMKLLYDIYLGPVSETTIDDNLKLTIFCNLKQIIDVSNALLNDLEENILNKSFEDVIIGKCFIKNAHSIKTIYAHYAQYIEHSNSLLEKCEKMGDIQRYIENGLNLIKQQINAFDLHSLLLKPIQRILKYPLLLQELIKYTETSHSDYPSLQLALTCMQDVATYINEIKRRRDLINKYGRRDKDQSTITDKMSKFTLHSMIKKSNRFSMRLSSVFGIHSSISADQEYDKLEAKYRCLEKLVKTFIKDSLQHLANFKDFLNSQTVTAESIQEYYGETQCSNIQSYVHVNSIVLTDIYIESRNFVHEKVVEPLNAILKLYEIPNKLIAKRHDKLLDYQCARTNSEKLKDRNLYKTVEDNLYEAQKNYEALNNQLLEELPVLIEKSYAILDKCVTLYLIALRQMNCLVGKKITENPLFDKEFLNQFQAIMSSTNGASTSPNDSQDAATANKQRTYRNLLSNNPVFQKIKSLANESGSATVRKCEPAATTLPMNEQDTATKTRLQSQYGKENIYKVTANYVGFGISSDLKLRKNDLVGVIKKADPCGNPTNWFVDNGNVKGIIPASIIQQFDTINITIQGDFSNSEDTGAVSIDKNYLKVNYKNDRRHSVTSNDSFEEDDSYKPTITKIQYNQPKAQYCIALYKFEALDSNTLSIDEGEKLKIVQKHDDNMNNEWWLVENESNNKVGYVPSNYIKLADGQTPSTSNSNDSDINNSSTII